MLSFGGETYNYSSLVNPKVLVFNELIGISFLLSVFFPVVQFYFQTL